ncbi:GDSL esterase/lipase At3g53100-like [Corylus avellana]|uniref:GDSL esterase/lipase At3g53100-like n=1 Tax=Corylus avellana TaxID=13451 RepID=UPI00286A29A5|nr:GDSL esterase/lipase At3g53100-like [Corylus avellana]XP_059433920.1 GDSL esterase/lipase At3g53100-like [Corylus avellana]XP_059433921.1 GDSL esterase/lipase At3g53100-like [Corylus avellana]
MNSHKHTISLSQQLEYYREYQLRVLEIAGRSNASTIISAAIYFLSAGNSDFLQNYYVDPLLQVAYSFDRFSNILVQSYTNFIQGLYALGGRMSWLWKTFSAMEDSASAEFSTLGILLHLHIVSYEL